MREIDAWIKSYESYNQFPCENAFGEKVAGFGRNMERNGITGMEALFLLCGDVDRCKKELSEHGWYTKQPRNVRDGLIHMCFAMGIMELLNLRAMIAALEEKDYTRAAMEALDSTWAKAEGRRALDVACRIRDGHYEST